MKDLKEKKQRTKDKEKIYLKKLKRKEKFSCFFKL